MSSYVENLIGQNVQIISCEGRVFNGELISFDQSTNVALKNCIEKIYSESNGVKFEKMGLYMLRGDNVAIISELNDEIEKNICYDKIRGKPIKEFILRDK